MADILTQSIGPFLSRELSIEGRWQLVSISLWFLVGITFIVGAVTHVWLGSLILLLVDQVLNHIHLVKLVYAAIKDGVNSFIGDGREFDLPLLVAIGDIQVPGLVTRNLADDFGLEEHVAVYFFMAFSIAGRVVLVPGDKIRPP